MPKDIWINLPVKDVRKSSAFFREIGFTLNKQFEGQEDKAGLIIGEKNVVVMLFPEDTFRNFISSPIANAGEASEVLLSIGADSKEEVDELLVKVAAAGGTIYSKPHDAGWMYGAGFADLDGHKWNVLYMDFSKMNG
ncbi:VOC family protein [Paenibacillus sp. BC26]|uniref:VOC family protein n=1 Tax=Paenibacillus sp. BC26 TaxID=1881032 RepID=UPI0008E09EFC|nr:VOC family protein [Paenibacillus sp. BC26]SFS70569.1 hypothetical protein SAMN05428962_2389 [Paenibacillus sp. BC26]